MASKTAKFDTEVNRAPALRISHIVFGRENDSDGPGGRVTYLVDPDGHGEERDIPEEVVIKRWRRRLFDGNTFHGARLSPNIWRAVDRAFGRDAHELVSLDTESVLAGRAQLAATREHHHFFLPNPDVLLALFEALGPWRLSEILSRHLSPERASRYGTPDLFLFARDRRRSGVAFYRMVEVKKPGEAISRDQHEEVAFLRSIGVPARVLRLIERKR